MGATYGGGPELASGVCRDRICRERDGAYAPGQMRTAVDATRVAFVKFRIWGGLDGVRRSRAGDGLLALVLLVAAETDVMIGSGWPGPKAFNCALVACEAAALVWRRSRPLLPLAVAIVATALQASTYGSADAGSGFFLIVVAVYSAAAHGRPLLVAVALTAIGVAIHDLGDPRIKTFGDAIYNSTMLGLVVLVGLAMRARQARTRTVEAEQETRAAEAVEEERRRIAQGAARHHLP